MKYFQFLILILIVYSNNALAESYYVSKNNGSDKNSGLSWQEAWKTLIYAGNIAEAGDVVNIRKSNENYRYLRVMNSGSEGAPIVFRGEDINNPPVLSGGKQLKSWENDGENIWKHHFANKMSVFLKKNGMFFEDGKPVKQASDQFLTDGQWYLKDNMLLYRPTEGTPTSHVVKVIVSGSGVMIHDKNWVVIDNIICNIGPGSCVSIKRGNYNKISNVVARWNWRGIDITDNSNGNTVVDSEFYFNREGLYIRNNSSFNSVFNCIAKYNGTLPLWKDNDRHAVAIGEDGPNIGNKVIGCEVAYNGGPPDNVALITFRGPDTIFENNNVHHNYGSGLFVTTDSDNTVVINNSVSSNGNKAVEKNIKGIAGLSIRNSKGVYVGGNRIVDNYVSNDSVYKNIYVGKHGGLDIEGAYRANMTGIILQDNLIKGTLGGPDLNISKRPKLDDIQIVNTPQLENVE